jgi:hypothetical protein
VKDDTKHANKRRRIDALLRDKKELDEDDQPTINKYYRDHFNVVDNFDKCLRRVSWPYAHHHHDTFYLVSCLRMATVNALSVWFELQDIKGRPKIRKHVRMIADELLK